MWIVQVTKTKLGHKLNSKKYSFQTRSEAEKFAGTQKHYVEIYQLEYKKLEK